MVNDGSKSKYYIRGNFCSHISWVINEGGGIVGGTGFAFICKNCVMRVIM